MSLKGPVTLRVRAPHGNSVPTNIVSPSYSGGGDMLLICHVTSCNLLFKWLCDSMLGSPLQLVTTLPSLVAMRCNVFEFSCDHLIKSPVLMVM